MGIHVIIVLCSEHVEVLLENNLNNQPDTCKVGEQLLLYIYISLEIGLFSKSRHSVQCYMLH